VLIRPINVNAKKRETECIPKIPQWRRPATSAPISHSERNTRAREWQQQLCRRLKAKSCRQTAASFPHHLASDSLQLVILLHASRVNQTELNSKRYDLLSSLILQRHTIPRDAPARLHHRCPSHIICSLPHVLSHRLTAHQYHIFAAKFSITASTARATKQ